VYAREKLPNAKAAVAAQIGARYVSSEDVPPDQLAGKFGAIDVVYEAAGASRVAFEVMQALGANSVFIFTGVPGRKAPVPIDTDGVMRNLVLKNQIVYGTVNAGRDAFEAAVGDVGEFLKRWPEATRGLISGRHPIAKARELLLGRASGIKHVLVFSE
jgi:threonine dehydrogenase-like Zn-dependent dehydrogenase